MSLQTLTGMKDLFSPEVEAWQVVEKLAHEHFALFGYKEIRTPLLEVTELFSRGIGEETGVVQKEMYTFADRDGQSITLRPEGTASVIRSFIENHFHQNDPITKLYYMGPMFRHERPQKGRLRQFHQIGCELIGSASPLADVENISLLDSFIKKTGITDYTLHLNSLGCLKEDCRPRYLAKLKEELIAHKEKLCADCQKRLETNPLRVLDCKKESCKNVVENLPTIEKFLCSDCHTHHQAVTEGLSNLSIAFTPAPRLVRGLDYYDRTAFEITSPHLGSQSAFAGGGRYSGLVKNLGGPDASGVGFAIGLERLLLLCADKVKPSTPVSVYLACLGKKALTEGLVLAKKCREDGIAVEMDYEEKSFKAMLRRANKMKFRFACLLGDSEIEKKTVQLKDMEKQTQEEIKMDQLLTFLKSYVTN